MLFIVVSVYAITWLPIHIMTIIGDLNPALYDNMFAHIMWLCFHWLAISNTGINPMVYCWINKTFRIKLKMLLSLPVCNRRKALKAQKRVSIITLMDSSKWKKMNSHLEAKRKSYFSDLVSQIKESESTEITLDKSSMIDTVLWLVNLQSITIDTVLWLVYLQSMTKLKIDMHSWFWKHKYQTGLDVIFEK